MNMKSEIMMRRITEVTETTPTVKSKDMASPKTKKTAAIRRRLFLLISPHISENFSKYPYFECMHP